MLVVTEWLELHALASKSQTKSNDQLLKNIKAKFQWVATQAGKLGIPPPLKLTTFKLSSAEKKVGIKRERRTELIHKVFVKDNIVVDGMQRNLTLPEGVVGKAGMNLVKIDSEYAQQVYDELIYEIKSRPDFVHAREIVEKNLDGLVECKASASNIKQIQVRVIVKEVKDYLKTYSSAGMDISWRDVSKNGRAFNAVVLPPQDSIYVPTTPTKEATSFSVILSVSTFEALFRVAMWNVILQHCCSDGFLEGINCKKCAVTNCFVEFCSIYAFVWFVLVDKYGDCMFPCFNSPFFAAAGFGAKLM
ncbi:hypothetical protein Tco_0456236 [Tanacetum coccineum]